MAETGLSTRAKQRGLSQPTVSCVVLFQRLLYIYYIHPELRISNCHFRSGKGAGPL